MIRYAFFILFFAVLLPDTAHSAEYKHVLGIGGSQWPPYLYENDAKELTGEDYLLLKNVLEELDYALDRQFLPEKRVGLQIANGSIDVVLGAAYNSLRAQNNHFSVPYRQEVITFAYMPSHHDEYAHKSLDELLQAGKTLALNTSGWYGKWFADNITRKYSSQLVHLDSVDRRLRFLGRGRVDLVLDDERVIEFNAQHLGLELEVSPTPVEHQPVHFMFSKRVVNKAFIEEFNEALLKHLVTEKPDT